MALFALYGTSMDPKVMLDRCPQSPLTQTGWLEGWRLTFGGDDFSWEGPLATIVQDPDHRVFVALYDVSPFDQEILDQWEGLENGLYRTIREPIHTLDGTRLACLYVLDTYEGGLPTARYIAMMADSAAAAGAPDDYVHALRTRPCAQD